MAKIPAVASRELVSGLKLISRGKVRDMYALANSENLLPVASDRISIFDFVLPAEVPQKGEVLTALNVFWYLALRKSSEVPKQDIVAYGKNIDFHLPHTAWNDSDLQKRAIVITKLRMLPIEAIVRGYLMGSGWGAYQKTAPNHKVCGHRLPAGFKDGDRLPNPIFTPTTKAVEGHDKHMDVGEVRSQFGLEIERASLNLFRLASEIALNRDIIIADTKLEFGLSEDGSTIILGDERFTPDSSRFCLLEDWIQSREKGTSPTAYDKQFVRKWGMTQGIHERDPLNPADVEYVHGLTVPEDILRKTTEIYRVIFALITGMALEAFQREKMGIRV